MPAPATTDGSLQRPLLQITQQTCVLHVGARLQAFVPRLPGEEVWHLHKLPVERLGMPKRGVMLKRTRARCPTR